MAIRLNPIKLDPDKLKKAAELAEQYVPPKNSFARSNDEENYPVWATPKGGNYLVYIPNHRMDDPATGEETLRRDIPLVHSVNDGGRFSTDYRCVKPFMVLDEYQEGCPLCEGSDICWDWYNSWADVIEAQHPGFKSSDDKKSKDLRSAQLNSRPVKQSYARHVFPVVIIEADDNYMPVKEAGKMKMKKYWMDLSANQFENITKALKLAGDQCPAGKLFGFDYNYDTKGKEPSAMLAAKNLTILHVADADSRGINQDVRLELDKATADWDIAKAIEMVVRCSLYSHADLVNLKNSAVASTVREIEQNQKQLAQITAGNSGSEEVQAEVMEDEGSTAALPSATVDDITDIIAQ